MRDDHLSPESNRPGSNGSGSEMPASGSVTANSISDSVVVTGDNNVVYQAMPPTGVYAALPQSELVKYIRRASLVRTRLRLAAVGLSGDQIEIARRQLDQLNAIDMKQLMRQGSVVTVHGSMGSGKSELAEAALRSCVDDYARDDSAPIPLWLDARAINRSLEESIVTIIGDVDLLRRRGAAFVVDGLDEIPQRSAQLMTEAYQFAGTWPASKGMLTSRSPEGAPKNSTHCVEPMSESQAFEFIKELNGITYAFGHGWPLSVREAVRRPLFALLVADDIAHNPGRSLTAASLIRNTAMRALRQLTAADPETLNRHLQELAVRSVRHDRPVREHTIGGSFVAKLLTSTKLVSTDGHGLRFVLPIFQQWFAAQGLLNGTISTRDVIGSLRDFDRWRYVLAVAVGSGDDSDVDDIMADLFRFNPGAAGWVAKEAITTSSLPNLQEEVEQPVWVDFAPRLRRIYEHVDSSVGPLKAVAGPWPPHDLGDLTLAVAINENWVVERWAIASIIEGPVTADVPSIWVEGNHPAFSGLARSSRIGAEETWLWDWVIKAYVDGLRRNLHRELHVVAPRDGVIFREYALSACSDLARTAGADRRRSVRAATQILADFLERTGDDDRARLAFQRKSVNRVDAGRLLDWLKGIEGDTFPDLWPGRDGDMGGWIWSGYSPPRLLERAVAIYDGALRAYRELADSVFSEFGDALGMRAKLPARLVGQVYPVNEAKGWAGQPGISYVIEPIGRPIADGSRSGTTSVELRLADETTPNDNDWDDWDSSPVWQRYRSYIRQNPDTAAFVRANSVYGNIELWDRRPATRIAFRWLWDDLVEAGWASRIAPELP